MSSKPFRFSDVHGDGGFMKLREVQPGGYQVLPSSDTELERIYNIEVRPEDVWQVGLQKSGTTWATEMIWTVYHGADVKTAREKNHYDRWIVAEDNIYSKDIWDVDNQPKEEVALMPDPFKRDNIKALEEWGSPRFIRTHLPLSLLPPKLLDTCKVVFVIRDFRDCWVSMYEMLSHMHISGEVLPFEDFVRKFLTRNAYLSPWTEVIKEAWEKRHHKNMFLVFYDEMKKDLPAVLKRLATFLGKPLTEEQIETLRDHLSFETMKTNSSINFDIWKGNIVKSKDFQFVRKGEVGGWKRYFSPELSKEYDEWWAENMAGTDFKFPEI